MSVKKTTTPLSTRLRLSAHTATTLMDFFRSRAHLTSAGLAAEHGVFPAYRGSRLQAQHQRQRNATVTIIAPTGRISLIAGRSPGIEPLYGVQEVRRIVYRVVLTSLHPAFARRARLLGLNLDSLRPDLATHPPIQHSTHIPKSYVDSSSRRMMSRPNIMCVCKRCFCDIATALSRNHQFAGHGDQSRGGRSLSARIPTRMQRPHRPSSRQPGPTSLFLQPFASLLNLASGRAIPQQN